MLFFVIGIASLIRSMGVNFLFVPGDLIDARFNNYVLEHFYLWLTRPDFSLWDANFYYPYRMTFAFSDNLFGAAPFYAAVRAIGFSRETAFQAWYLLGYALNYLSAAFALRKISLSPLAAAAGAFFFAFGIPMLAQEGHPQLVYRCGVPLTCYFLWDFARRPRLHKAILCLALLVWQFYLTIYIGFFLTLILIVLFCAIPFFMREESASVSTGRLRQAGKAVAHAFCFWPMRLRTAWQESRIPGKGSLLIGIPLCLALLVLLFRPYLEVSGLYGLGRNKDEIATMLPRLGSYWIADNALFGANILRELPMRHEHQLFPGLGVSLLVIIGLLWKQPEDRAGFRRSHMIALAAIVLLTLTIREKSLYFLFYEVPGFNSIRAVSRVQLVLMWPLAVSAAFTVDALRRAGSENFRTEIALGLLVVLTLCESVFYPHSVYSKIEGQARVDELRRRAELAIARAGIEDPVLLVRAKKGDPWMLNSVDAMLAAQEMGVPTINGYSGNAPNVPFMEWIHSCETLPGALDYYNLKAEEFTGIEDLNIRQRIIPLRFLECVPSRIRTQ